MVRSDQLYTEPEAMEPLLPTESRAEMAELTCEILRKSGRLAGIVPSTVNRESLRRLVQEMNSYYSNLIEGHKTRPRDIERALTNTFDVDVEKRANQHLAKAHIEVEQLIWHRLGEDPATEIHSPDFLAWIHGEFYRRLPSEQHFSARHNGTVYPLVPGGIRKFEVTVGRHQPPYSGAVSKFLRRFGEYYGNPQILPPDQLIALAAAHHRLAWIHPFGDGNGRVTRLHSHAWLIRDKVDGFGLWTLSRGLARRRAEYYRLLQGADGRRRNDYDGRGNLSMAGLVDFCRFLLETMLDQIDFMSDLLELSSLGRRMERFVQFELGHLKPRPAERLVRLLKAGLYEGEIGRGRVTEIVGLSLSASRGIIGMAEEEGLMHSLTPKGALRLRFDSRTLESYFPKLYTDLPVEGEV